MLAFTEETVQPITAAGAQMCGLRWFRDWFGQQTRQPDFVESAMGLVRIVHQFNGPVSIRERKATQRRPDPARSRSAKPAVMRVP